MTETVTAMYESKDQVRNAVDDLISTGIPREKFRVDDDKLEVAVLTAETTEPEIKEILMRHQPTSIS
jgi:hypothetical protein